MAKKWYAQVSNRLIEDCSLQHSTKKVAFAMLVRSRRRNGMIRVSLQELAAETGCSVSTVQRAVQELIGHGYITKERNYRYSMTLGRPVLTKNTYRINQFPGGYTLVPRSILTSAVSFSCFSVMLYLYRCAGRTGRAYPSIRTMAHEIYGSGASKASVCRALIVLKELGFFIKLFCQKLRGDLSCNSYYLTCMVRKNGQPQAVEKTAAVCPDDSPVIGGLKLSKRPWINKITKVSILREREKGVGQFGRFHKFIGTLRGFWKSLIKRPSTTNTG